MSQDLTLPARLCIGRNGGVRLQALHLQAICDLISLPYSGYIFHTVKMSQAEAGSAPDESPSPASLAGQSGQTAPLEPKTLPTGQQDKCETEVETDVDRLGDVAAEEAAESRSEIVYEEEQYVN